MSSTSSRMRRSSPRAVLAVAGAAVLTAGGGVAFASGGGGTGAGVKPVHSVAAQAPGQRVGHAWVVRPGERVVIAPGGVMWLEKGSAAVEFKGRAIATDPWHESVANVPWGTLSWAGFGDQAGGVWWGLYRGPGTLDHVVVTEHGPALHGRTVTERAQVITLPGHPGWAAIFATGPNLDGNGPLLADITGYSADGSVLAQGHR